MSKMQWKCRRGMLELDLWLTNYLKTAYPASSLEEKVAFDALLSESDTDIWEWLTNAVPVEPAFLPMIRKIQNNNHIPVPEEQT